MNISNEKLAYWAGIIDGEGCVQLYKTKKKNSNWTEYYLRVRVLMTLSDPIIKELQNHWGGTFRECQPPGNRRRISEWQIFGKKSIPFLESIYPFLVLKKKKVANIIAFQEYMTNSADKSKVTTEEEWNTRENFYKKDKFFMENPFG